MKTLITRIKRLALALCFVTPLVSWAAVDYTGTDYEPWLYSAGCVVWRAASAQVFHVSTVADVAANGTIGETYALGSSDHPWQVFASNQTAYSAPGKTLVFDEAGYNTESDAQFAPLSFGGLWVKALQAEGVPYSITDDKTDSTNRQVELGATNTSTYFKFDKSFTFDRNSATAVKGTATVEIADGATFTINNRASKGAKVDSGNTLVLTGANTGTLKVVAGLTVGGTLDLSAATRPAIDGDVTLSAGSTIVLPAGTDVSETPFTVCSGTLTSGGVINVKVGSADAEKALVTVGNGAITAIATTVTYTATIDGDTAFSAIEWTVGGEAATITSMDIAVLEISGTGVVTGLTEAPAKVTLASGVTLDVTELSAEAFAGIEKSTAGTYRWTSGFPIIVPQGWTYEYVGGSTEAGTVTISEGMLNDQGNLKTSGYLSIDNFWMGWTTASLDILDGKTTIGANTNEKALRGTVTIREDAELVNTRVSDALAFDASAVVNVYGTLSMGATRWSLGSNNTLNFYEGCTVTGSGQSSNGTFDWIENATANLNVTGSVTIDAPIRIREGATVNVTVDSGANDGLTLGTTIGIGKIVKKGAGLIKFTTNPSYAITCQNGAFTFGVNATPTITYTAKPSNSTSMWYAQQSTWRGTVVIGNLNAPAALPLNTWGNENSKIVLTGTTGSCYLNGTTTVAAELVVGTNENSVVEFNNGNSDQVGTFSKVSGPGTLKLVAWGGCRAATYVLNTLNNFDGLAVANNITRGGGGTFTVRIGNILTTSSTDPGDCVLPIVNTAAENATGTVVYDLANAQVNGNTLDLEAKSDGIYVVVPTVTITVPTVENASVVVSDGTTTYTPTPEGGTTYSVPAGATITVTYTSDGYEVTGGTFEFTASEGYTVDTTEVVTKQYVASITVGETTTKYTTLQAAIDAVAQNKDIVLLANEADGATVAREATFNVVPGEYTHGDIAAGGNYILTTTASEGKTRYSVSAALMAVTINDVRTLYPATMDGYTAAIEAANAGPIGTTLKVLYGDYTAYVEYLPMFDLDTDTGVFTKVADPVAAVYNGMFQQQVYRTLAEAVTAATSGQTVKLLADVDLTATQTIDKNLTIDLNGHNVTSTDCRAFHVTAGTVAFTGSGTVSATADENVNTSTFPTSSSVIRVGSNDATTSFTLGADVRVSSDYCYGITYFGTQAQTVVINGTVSVTGEGAAVSGNGTSTLAATTLTVNGTVSATQEYAIYNPQAGTTAINGTVTGLGGVEVKGGTVTVGATAKITATGTPSYTQSNQNGTSTVGYAIASVGNSSYKQPAVVNVEDGATVTGTVIIIKENKSETYGIVKSAVNTLTIPEGFTWGTASEGYYTLAVSSGINPTDPTSTQEVTPTAEEIAAAGGSAEAAAIAKATVTVPAEVTGVDAPTYKSYFKFRATATETEGVYAVTITGFADEVTETADGNALAALEAATAGDTLSAEVAVKPGLYYGTAAGADVTTLKAPAGTLNTTGKLDLSGVTKPSTGEAFFIKIKVSTTAFTAEK